MGALTSVFANNPWVKDFLAKKLPKLHLAGKSDHSKIVIADAFTQRPSMWVASKNPTDNNLLNYDEGMVVKGPAAALAQLAFGPDLRLAAEQTLKVEKYKGRATDRSRGVVTKWLGEMQRLSDGSQGAIACAPPPAPGEAAQNVDIRWAENNGDDSVRNVEHTVLQLIRGAKKNVRMYNMLAYNPGVAEAFADAIARLGSENVKMIIDQALTFTPNLIFHEMVGAARVHLNKTTPDVDAQARLNSWDNSFRWRVGLKSKRFDAPAQEGAYKRIDIDQQQHSKTIIIDDETIFLGSANFDLITFGGSFREFSIAARTQQGDAKAREEVAKATKIFDDIWNALDVEVKTTAGIRAERAKDVPSAAVLKLAAGMLTGEHKVRHGLMPLNIPLESECR
jgi:phosphatidylserine/phosphatidylglycerophosphate/cardiolipin synthase-like enzyme